MAFKEPVHKIMEKIKHEPYFRWPVKMGGDSTKRNQSLYCTYHRDKEYTTEQCRTFKDYLEWLVRVGHLREYMVGQGEGIMGQMSRSQGGTLPLPLGIIKVIHVASIRVSASHRRGILSITPQQELDVVDHPGRSPGWPKRKQLSMTTILREPPSHTTTHWS